MNPYSTNCHTKLLLSIALIFASFSTTSYTAPNDNRSGKRSHGAPKPKPQPKGVVARFSAAMKLYDAGKYAEALVAFDQIHRAYPAHEPTIVQYAKTLYRLDRIPESYNLFARVNPQYLDPETSYEYGYAFYSQNKYEPALFAFKKVPVDHALYDLASYYGAMCAIRLKRYTEADELLDKAVVLPDKLAKTKPLYQKHVGTLRQLQEKNELDRATNEEKLRYANEQKNLNQTLKNTPPPSQQAAASTQPVNTSGYIIPHGGFFRIYRQSQLKAVQLTQETDYHTFSRKSFQQQSGIFSLNHGPYYLLPYKQEEGRQAAIAAQVDLSVKSQTTSGKRERLVAYEESQDIVHTLTEQLPSSSTTIGDIGGSVWAETPLPSGWWLGANGHLSFTYPDFSRKNRFGVRGMTGHVGWKKDARKSWVVELTETFDQIVDSETEPLTNKIITIASACARTPFDLWILAEGKYVVYDYKLPVLPGPDSSIGGTLSLQQDFPLGMTFELNGSVEQQQNYIVRNVGSFESASADGQILSGYAKFSATPFPWITISAKYGRSQATWVVAQIEREEAFKATTPSYTESTELLGSLNFLF